MKLPGISRALVAGGGGGFSVAACAHDYANHRESPSHRHHSAGAISSRRALRCHGRAFVALRCAASALLLRERDSNWLNTNMLRC